MSEQKKTVAPQAAQNGEDTQKTPAVVCVDASTPFEKVLEWDKKGLRVTFNTDSGHFKELSAEELDRCSAWFKSTYRVMREVARTQNPEADEFARHFKVTNPALALGSPLQRIRGVKTVDGVKPMFFRPDLLADAYEKGYRPPRDGEVLGGAHKRDGHYELPDVVTGGTEQVLLVKDTAQLRKDEAEFTRGRIALGDQKADEAKEAVKRTGYGVKDAPDGDE